VIRSRTKSGYHVKTEGDKTQYGQHRKAARENSKAVDPQENSETWHVSASRARGETAVYISAARSRWLWLRLDRVKAEERPVILPSERLIEPLAKLSLREPPLINPGQENRTDQDLPARVILARPPGGEGASPRFNARPARLELGEPVKFNLAPNSCTTL
jgi:hypothetical protein